MRKVKDVEMLPPDDRERGDEDGQHYQSTKNSSEDEGRTPDTEGGRITGPDLVIQIRGVQYREDHVRGEGPSLVVGRDP